MERVFKPRSFQTSNLHASGVSSSSLSSSSSSSVDHIVRSLMKDPAGIMSYAGSVGSSSSGRPNVAIRDLDNNSEDEFMKIHSKCVQLISKMNSFLHDVSTDYYNGALSEHNIQTLLTDCRNPIYDCKSYLTYLKHMKPNIYTILEQTLI